MSDITPSNPAVKVLKDLFCGSMAGIGICISGYPLDTLKGNTFYFNKAKSYSKNPIRQNFNSWTGYKIID